MTFKDKPKRPSGKPQSRDRKPNFGSKPAFSEKKREFEPRKSEAPVVAQPGAKPERISKIMARAGVASRRDVEKMIMEGRVSLNGKVLESPAINATLNDKIEVDGQPIRGAERTRLWIYHKPAGLVTTNSDPEGRPTVFENLPPELPRVLSIGRLDINTEGLLLLTNDGGLSRVLELPTTGWLRRYRVRAYGEVDQAKLDTLKEGIAVDGVLYGAIDATLDRQQGHNVWISMGLREGKNREIKNVLGALGLEVNRLIRVSYGPFQLGDLPEGKVIEVRGRMLRDQLGPRLIEASGANFDAPLYNEGPAADEADAKPRAGAKPTRDGAAERPRGRRDDDARSLDRWSTSKPSSDGGRGAPKGRGGDDAGEERSFSKRPGPGFGSKRPANVWIAPGGRPTTEPVKPKRPGTVEKDRSLRSSTPEAEQKRVKINRVPGDRDWIRADETPREERGFGGRGGRDGNERRGGKREDRGFSRSGDRPQGERKSFGDRPPRGDRPFGDRPPRGERPEGDRPARSFDKPRGERSFGDKPRGDRPFGDRPPRGERPEGDRPARSFDKPRGDKPFGGKPSGGRPTGGKPFGGKPSGGKPSGGRPSGDRPSGGKGPSDGKGMNRNADRRR